MSRCIHVPLPGPAGGGSRATPGTPSRHARFSADAAAEAAAAAAAASLGRKVARTPPRRKGSQKCWRRITNTQPKHVNVLSEKVISIGSSHANLKRRVKTTASTLHRVKRNGGAVRVRFNGEGSKAASSLVRSGKFKKQGRAPPQYVRCKEWTVVRRYATGGRAQLDSEDI